MANISAAASWQSEDTNTRGIAHLVVGLSLFTIQDVTIKLLSDELALLQILFLRSLVALVPICWLVHREGGWRGFHTRHPVLNAVRGCLIVTCYSSFYMALAVLPLADAMTLFYTNPLFVTALSVPILGEIVGPRRWLALLVGFMGVLVVVQPGATEMEPAMILGIFSALAYSATCLLTRHMATSEGGAGMSFHTTIFMIVVSGAAGLLFGDGSFDLIDHPSAAFMLRAWPMPDAAQWMLILVIGLIAGVGFYCLSQAYRLGRASVVAPFEYSSLPLAVLWGWVFWASIPTWTTILGSALIVGSGLYIIRREMVVGRKLVTRRGLRRQF